MKSYFTRDRILLTIRTITSMGIVLFLIFYIDLNKIIKTLSSANLFILLIVFFLSFLNLFLQFKKWQLVARHELDEYSSSKVVKSLFYGIGAGMFTPMKIGEYVARAVPFNDKKISDVSIATFIDKVMNMILIILIGGILFIHFIFDKYVITNKISLGIYIACLLLIPLALILLYFTVKSKSKIAKLFNLSEKISQTLKKLSVLRLIKGVYFHKILFFAFSLHLIFSIQFALLLTAYSPENYFLHFLIISNLVFFTQIIIPPMFLGELGIREGATVFYMQSFGFEPSVGFSAAFTLFVINFILPSIYSLFITAKKLK